VRRGHALVSWGSYGTKENIIIKKIIAAVLVVLGLGGILLGRLGETVWAPPTSHTASVTLKDPGPAVVIDPGVLYVGGTEGTATIEADGDVSMITASNDDIDAYLKGVTYTRVTGVPTWQTLSTEQVDADGKDSLKNPTDSDLWRSVDTSKSPATVDVSAFADEEMTEDPQPYRAILLVTDGKKAGATKIAITWPADEKNAWVPYAYAGGAAIAVIGLALLVVSLSFSRRPEPESAPSALGDEDHAEPDEDHSEPDEEAEPTGAEGDDPERHSHAAAVPGLGELPADASTTADDTAADDDTGPEDASAPFVSATGGRDIPTGAEENAWGAGEPTPRRGRHASRTPDEVQIATADGLEVVPGREETDASGTSEGDEPATDVIDPVDQGQDTDGDRPEPGSHDRREHE
jgi:hypothetical protein